VYYPGLADHPGHAVAAQQMTGFGGVVAVELAGGYAHADRFLGALRYARRAASLGSVHSLVVHPASMWQGMLDADQIAGAGVPEGLVRLAMGIEDTEDIEDTVGDVLNALEQS
jgi:methionine-gamma-lyase